jgi:hypothetical protein
LDASSGGENVVFRGRVNEDELLRLMVGGVGGLVPEDVVLTGVVLEDVVLEDVVLEYVVLEVL